MIFIADLEEQIERNNLFSMFAEDGAVSATRRTLEEGRRDVQAALNTTAYSSKQWHLTISEAKCEATFLTNFGPEISWTPSLQIIGKEIFTSKNITFLGIKYDLNGTR